MKISKIEVDKIFVSLGSATTVTEIEAIEYQLSKVLREEFRVYDEYGKLLVEFTEEEIVEVENMSHKEIYDFVKNHTVAKLLYTALWKQGDLGLLEHIIGGFSGKEPATKTSYVFNQLGKHIRDRREPIIDQHVLRAYDFWKNSNESPTKNITYSLQPKLIPKYRKWISELKVKEALPTIDRILFALGKKLKEDAK